MASFSSLATELLAHILKLSIEGEPAQERQRFRLAFGLISRACFLATADAAEFCIEGEAQAKAFVSQLEQEKKWAAQEERKARSGRTSRSALSSVTRVSNVRRLTIIVVDSRHQKVFADLLRAIPNLTALDLVVGPTMTYINVSLQLSVAVGGLVGLQELRVHTKYLDGDILLPFLNPLKALEVLDLEVESYGRYQLTQSAHLEPLCLPHLRKVAIKLMGRADGFPNTILANLAAQSTAGIQALDLKASAYYDLFSQIIEPLLPHLTNVVHLTWESPHVWPQNDSRDAILAILGTMKKLVSISISMWSASMYMVDVIPYGPYYKQPIDRTLFDTLATLPSLQSVKLIVQQGELSTVHVITYLNSHKSLRSLSIHFLGATWTREEQDAVEEAAERAGVAFS
ncbi:hypothetical protein RQP46_008057 [Phenoliferia psychrophenolica]